MGIRPSRLDLVLQKMPFRSFWSLIQNRFECLYKKDLGTPLQPYGRLFIQYLKIKHQHGSKLRMTMMTIEIET